MEMFQVSSSTLISSSFGFEPETKAPLGSSRSPLPWKPKVTPLDGGFGHPTPAPLSSPIFSLAFSFGFEALTAHAELKVQGNTVTWEPQGVKGHDPRLRGKENKSR